MIKREIKTNEDVNSTQKNKDVINEAPSKKVFCDKCRKWHMVTITQNEKFAICPNKRCGYMIII